MQEYPKLYKGALKASYCKERPFAGFTYRLKDLLFIRIGDNEWH